MEELRLPWNNREGLLYGGVIALITGFLMMTFNMCKTLGGVRPEYIENAIIAMPLLWVVIMLLMTFLVGRVSDYLIRRFGSQTDSVNARIVMNIVCCVAMMSVIMTAIGPLVGSLMSLTINLEGFENWINNWPVNFCVAFWIEMLLAQPIARMIMKRKHIRALKSRNTGAAVSE